MFLFNGCFTSDELIEKTTSPNGVYSVEVYLSNPGATSDYSIKAYLQIGNLKKLIYNKYHDYNANIKWINDNVISINDIHLDLSKGETYDWRNNPT